MKTSKIKRRWTLGALMVVIALVAVPLAWFAYQAREVDRQRRIAESRRELSVDALRQISIALQNYQNYEKAQRVQSPSKSPAEAAETPK